MFFSHPGWRYGIVLTAFTLLAGCNSEKNHSDANDIASTQGEETQETAHPKSAISKFDPMEKPFPPPDYTLSAVELSREYKHDKAATDKKYAGKQIRVTGKVESFHRMLMGGGRMVLEVPSNESDSSEDLDHVSLKMHDLEHSPWSKVALGQQVTVQGQFPKYISYGPDLEDCRIVEATGEMKVDYISADQLADDLSTEHQQTDQKYAEKQVYLTGKIKSIDLEENSRFELGSDQKTSAILWVEHSSNFFHLTAGQEIKVIGTYETDRSDSSVPELREVLLVEPQLPTGNLGPTKMVGNTPHFTADRLVEAYRSNPRLFIYCYRHQQKRRDWENMNLADLAAESEKNKIQIEGVIEKAVKEKVGWSIYYKNSLNHEILCGFMGASRSEEKLFKPGVKITIRGSLLFNVDSLPDEAVVLILCDVISDN